MIGRVSVPCHTAVGISKDLAAQRSCPDRSWVLGVIDSPLRVSTNAKEDVGTTSTRGLVNPLDEGSLLASEHDIVLSPDCVE